MIKPGLKNKNMENYKEKYEEALDNFKKIKAANKGNKELVDFIEYKYPELKESENERIRKSLIEHINEITSWNYFLGISKEQMIAWLEKQAKQKPEMQKSADKIEPKFKVGDWCIDNEDGTICQIMKVLDNTYTYKTNEGEEYSCPHYSLENDTHLWTIQDAKDGDVLASKNGCPFIYKKSDGTVAQFYCCVSIANNFCIGNDIVYCGCKELVKPATKEQRDLLFSKIKEAGYEWDAEKKELKKIEQKPTWSEEDKKKIDLLIAILEVNYPKGQFKVNPINTLNMEVMSTKELVDWLKSLKERYTWKPSKEQIDAFEHFVRSVGESGYASPYNNNTKLLYSLLQQLKKLRGE